MDRQQMDDLEQKVRNLVHDFEVEQIANGQLMARLGVSVADGGISIQQLSDTAPAGDQWQDVQPVDEPEMTVDQWYETQPVDDVTPTSGTVAGVVYDTPAEYEQAQQQQKRRR